MPLFAEPMVLKWTGVGVGLMIVLAVDTFEEVRVRLALFGFETQRIDLKVGLVAPSEVAVVFNFVRAITFQASHTLKSTCKDSVIPLPTILAL